jgi:hypothetical protein
VFANNCGPRELLSNLAAEFSFTSCLHFFAINQRVQ